MTTPDPLPTKQRRPRALILLVQIQSLWLITAGAGRVVIVLSGDGHLDPLPFISFGLGLVGFFVLTTWAHRR